MPIPRTSARDQLRDALRPGPDQRMTQGRLAAELGVSQPSVSAWVNLTARPDPHYREAIERLLGIPASGWMTAAERQIATTPRTRARRRRVKAPKKDAKKRAA